MQDVKGYVMIVQGFFPKSGRGQMAKKIRKQGAPSTRKQPIDAPTWMLDEKYNGTVTPA